MIIAVTARGEDLVAAVDPRFGQTAAFVVLDPDTGTVRALDNREASDAGHGAGIQAAQVVPANGAQVLLTGHCGPTADRALRTAGVRVYTGVAEGTIRKAITQFQAGLLHEAAGADVQPHS